MAIAHPPKAPATNGRKAESFIARAANGNSPNSSEAKDDVAVTVRVPPDVLQQIDNSVKGRRVRTPRHAWLLEAIYAKLDSEKP